MHSNTPDGKQNALTQKLNDAENTMNANRGTVSKQKSEAFNTHMNNVVNKNCHFDLKDKLGPFKESMPKYNSTDGVLFNTESPLGRVVGPLNSGATCKVPFLDKPRN